MAAPPSRRPRLASVVALTSLVFAGGCAHLEGGDAPWEPPSYYSAEHYAELAGVETCYLEGGPPASEAETIVFVHGWSGNVQNWWDQFEHFQARYHVVAFDAPGHGKSERSADIDYSMDLHVDVLEALLDELAIDEAILVGNSGGAWTAANYAIRNPERVTKLVLSDSTGTRYKGMAGAVLNMITPAFLEMTKVTEGTHYPGLDAKSLARQEFVVSYDGTVEEIPYLEALAELLPPMYEEISAEELASITAPTLILWGDDDSVVPINAMKVLDKRIPDSETYVVHLGGHTPMMNSPDEFNCALASFLTETDPRQCKQYALNSELRQERLAGHDTGPHFRN